MHLRLVWLEGDLAGCSPCLTVSFVHWCSQHIQQTWYTGSYGWVKFTFGTARTRINRILKKHSGFFAVANV